MKILDAAELLFAERGYFGVSLRDIAVMAKTEIALASYHFGSKDGLFLAVVKRRSEEHVRDMYHSLQAAITAAAPHPPSNEALVRAYGGPPLEKIRRDKGWAAYIKLIVGLQNTDRADPLSLLANPVYDDAIKAFVDAFISANPGVSRRKILLAVYFLHGSFIHILSQTEAFERLLPDEPPMQGTDDLLDELADFFARRMTSAA